MSEPVEYVGFDWGQRRCRVSPLGAKASRAVAVRLANKIGAGMKQAGLAGAGNGAAGQSVVVGALLENLDEATTDWLTDTFLRVTEVESEPGDARSWKNPSQFVDLMFGGPDGLLRWFRWLNFCVEQSCGAFFRAALLEMSPSKAPAKSPSPSPTT